MAWLCGDNHLPEAGGMLDQDYPLVTRMAACRNIYQTLSRLRDCQGEQIHQLTRRERLIIRALREEGLIGA